MNNNTIYNTARGIAFVAGVFSIVVCVLIISSFLNIQATDPLNSPSLDRLRSELRDRPDDDALKNEIRALDTQVRRAFFYNLVSSRTGAWLLLAGTALTLAALKTMSATRKKLPHPGKYQVLDNEKELAAFDRRVITAGGTILVVTALVMTGIVKNGLDGPPPAPGSAGNEKTTYASREKMLKNWPAFRGPDNLGVAYVTNAPITWDGKTGKNILWKVPNPALGFNSPIVWEKQLFMSGGTEQMVEVICMDADTGKITWRRPADNIPGSPAKPPELMEDTGYAPSTMTTDGERVFAIFPTGNVICFDLSGKRSWARNLGVPKNTYGYASSLVTYQDLLMIQYDNEKNPRVLALKTATGKTAWEVSRQVKPSWASPSIIYPDNKAQLVVNSNPLVNAYDPLTGKSLWTIKCMSGEVAPSPAYGKGLVYVTTQYAVLAAIKPVPEPVIAWKVDESLPEVSSPTANDKFIFAATGDAELTCYEAGTGKKLWYKEFDDGFYSSPILAGDRLYLMDMKGVMLVIKAEDKYEEIGRSELGEKSSCTPAFVGNRIYIRGNKNIYCVERSGTSGAGPGS